MFSSYFFQLKEVSFSFKDLWHRGPGQPGSDKRLWRLAPTNFTRKLALQRLAVVVLRIRSTTEITILRQSALEKVKNLSRTESPRRGGRNKSNHDKRRHTAAAAHDGRWPRGKKRRGGDSYSLGFCESCCIYNVALGSRTYILTPPMLNKLSSISVRQSRTQYLCDPQWFRDTASRGPTTIATPKTHFRTDPSDHGKAPSNIAP
ncbi:formin-like protein 7 [Dorcoceras hygrometricum]|uniref:Formin-like protein 7 n=1 Tax=Dorcoceras hygrometricum TaxID=472368 RepID=A0A2Z7DDZ3_9LAMI|nr:formin-like protein 7 [Dorcoceras hygrometricum]